MYDDWKYLIYFKNGQYNIVDLDDIMIQHEYDNACSTQNKEFGVTQKYTMPLRGKDGISN